MKTEIYTVDLLKIINPSKEGIFYREQQVPINFKILKEFVDFPKKNQVFNLTGDFTNDLHKNLALYIINANEDPRLIHIDLNKENIFEQGLFEYIKRIYNKDKTCYINIDEVGDNLLLIKSKKLEQLPDSNQSQLPNPKTIKSAEDTHYASIASIFSETKKIDLSNINKDKLATKGQVTWEEDNYNNYANQNYVLEKIKNIVEPDKSSRSYGSQQPVSYEEQFNKIISMTDASVLNSEQFKLAIIDIDNSSLNDILVNRYYHEKENKDYFFINFSEQIFQDKLLTLVKGEKFKLIENLFIPHRKAIDGFENYPYKHYKKPSSDINFELLINQPETIKHLTNKYHYGSYYSADKFDIVSVYKFLNDTTKKETAVIDKYLKLIIEDRSSRSSSESRYVNETLLFKLPPELFNDKEFLNKVIDVISFSKLKEFLIKNSIEPTTLADKDFMLGHRNLSDYKLRDWIICFADKKILTKDFFKDILSNRPKFYSELGHWEKFQKDIELINLAVRCGFELKNINSSIMYDLLLIDHEAKYENLKIQYLIEKKNIIDIVSTFKHVGYAPEEVQKIKEKYEKPEYMFYKVDDWHSEYDNAKRTLSKIKNVDEVLKVLDKIENSSFCYDFNTNFFYQSLHKPLQKNRKLVEAILDIGPIRYASLDENLAYNSDIVIKCLSRNPKDLRNIPQEFFSSSHFAIEFAKLMDQHLFEEKDLPSFIIKFFENQEVTRDYENYLKMHLSYKEMQGDLEPSNPQVKTKRVKL
jgi:hypothetical protein